MSVVRHVSETWERVEINQRVAFVVVVVHAGSGVGVAATLPVVVEAHWQRDRLAAAPRGDGGVRVVLLAESEKAQAGAPVHTDTHQVTHTIHTTRHTQTHRDRDTCPPVQTHQTRTHTRDTRALAPSL